MEKFKHPSALKLFDMAIDSILEKKSGTYNQMDPTYYSKGDINIDIDGQSYQICYYDCTWGISLRIFHLTKKGHTLIYELYKDFSDKVILNHHKDYPKGIWKLLYKFIRTDEAIINRQFHEDLKLESMYCEEDPMGGMGRYI